MGLIDIYKRQRHSFGFGIHSPSAYRYVREVIRLPRGMAYYAYESLPDTPSTIHSRLLYRVAHDLQPATYAVSCDNSEQRRAIEAVIRAAAPEAIAAAPEALAADLVVACDKADTALNYRVAVVAPKDHPIVNRRLQLGGSGHIYRSASAAIIREDCNVPFQVFDIAF